MGHPDCLLVAAGHGDAVLHITLQTDHLVQRGLVSLIVQLFKHIGFQIYFTAKILLLFSPFPHGTCSLSIVASQG
jgi:predicted NACHT family NTPase